MTELLVLFEGLASEAWYIPVLIAAGTVGCKFFNRWKAKKTGAAAKQKSWSEIFKKPKK
tara:strand:- start:3287 stop:3463 length:177 start_codon:yes stop_codon:yes gene_type:complete